MSWSVLLLLQYWNTGVWTRKRTIGYSWWMCKKSIVQWSFSEHCLVWWETNSHFILLAKKWFCCTWSTGEKRFSGASWEHIGKLGQMGHTARLKTEYCFQTGSKIVLSREQSITSLEIHPVLSGGRRWFLLQCIPLLCSTKIRSHITATACSSVIAFYNWFRGSCMKKQWVTGW